MKRGRQIIDITGQRFGQWTVLNEAERKPGNRIATWLCRCDCGQESIVFGTNLRSGQSTSCGCRSSKKNFDTKETSVHGARKALGYSSWVHMKERCYNPNCNRYQRYGGRGIKICAHWRESFKNFFADMGKKPSKEYSIDRINNDANYSCGHCEECKTNGWTANCRWATSSEQNLNKDRIDKGKGRTK